MRSRTVSPRRAFSFSYRRPAIVDFFKHFEQVHLWLALFPLRRDFAFVLAEQGAGAFTNGQQARSFAGNFHKAVQIFQVRAKSLRNFARCVIFQDEASDLGLLRVAFGLVVASSSSPLSPLVFPAFTVQSHMAVRVGRAYVACIPKRGITLPPSIRRGFFFHQKPDFSAPWESVAS